MGSEHATAGPSCRTSPTGRRGGGRNALRLGAGHRSNLINDGKSEAANSGQCLATFGQGSPSRLARGLSRKALERKAERADLGIAKHAGYLGQVQAGVAEILTSEIGAQVIEDPQKARHSV